MAGLIYCQSLRFADGFDDELDLGGCEALGGVGETDLLQGLEQLRL